jgi:RNA polymerase sigma-70 factor (ECF subfamily)
VSAETLRRSNADWIDALQSSGPSQAAALTDLRLYLKRAALFTLHRARHHVGHLGAASLDALAEDCAQDALSAIVQHLGDFRGDSRFTTWAYAFAINMALVAARRERWGAVSLDRILGDGASPAAALPDRSGAPDPERQALRAEVTAAVREGIEQHLTPRQQQVLRALVVDEVPLDEIVRHLGSNRNAVYKLVHDARVKLKRHLVGRGFDVQEILDLFGAAG